MDSAQSGSLAVIDADGSAPGGVPHAGAVALRRPGLPTAPETWVEPGHGVLAKAAKRAIDLFGALFLIAILLPFMLVTAVLIKLDSSGPILFRQRRIGGRDEALLMLKFRTMIDGADEQKAKLLHLNEAAEGLFKISGDPRVTRVGRWLRATSLDELPQLFHVLTGRPEAAGPGGGRADHRR
jgi:lipopolysaccharide/colanic/teichoic acid biosynthesis glycosyltransferase